MRTLVALLLLANLGWLALARGWLQPYVGLSSHHEREPQRLAAQLNAASVRVLAADEVASLPSASACIQAGPFDSEQIDAAEAALPASAAWQRQPADSAGEGRAAQFWLRMELPDAALLQRLHELAAATPGSSVSACPTPR